MFERALALTPRIAQTQPRIQKMRTWIWNDDHVFHDRYNERRAQWVTEEQENEERWKAIWRLVERIRQMEEQMAPEDMDELSARLGCEAWPAISHVLVMIAIRLNTTDVPTIIAQHLEDQERYRLEKEVWAKHGPCPF